MKYHKIIKDLRTDNDVSQQTIADFIGIDRVSYNRIENGHYAIKFDYVIKIAEFYNISIDYLAGLIDKPIKLDQRKNEKQLSSTHTHSSSTTIANERLNLKPSPRAGKVSRR